MQGTQGGKYHRSDFGFSSSFTQLPDFATILLYDNVCFSQGYWYLSKVFIIFFGVTFWLKMKSKTTKLTDWLTIKYKKATNCTSFQIIHTKIFLGLQNFSPAGIG